MVLDGESWNVIPVTRYAKGMSRGLYFEEASDVDIEYCGTFYYHEPESTTLLAYKTSESFFNKYTCAKELDPSDLATDILEDVENNTLLMYIKGKLPKNLMLTPLEAYDLKFIPEKWTREEVTSLPQNKRYVGKTIGLYALEDLLDQIICELAQEANLDIVVLRNMSGIYQVVTEILDVRKREDSFKSLLYLEEKLI